MTQNFAWHFLAINISVALSQISQDLHCCAAWCYLNQLLINPDKTKLILSYSVCHKNKLIDFFGTKILQSPWCRELGITLDSHLTFNNHIINSLIFIAVINPLPDKLSETSLRWQNSANNNQLSSIQQTLLLFNSLGWDIAAKYP